MWKCRGALVLMASGHFQNCTVAFMSRKLIDIEQTPMNTETSGSQRGEEPRRRWFWGFGGQRLIVNKTVK